MEKLKIDNKALFGLREISNRLFKEQPTPEPVLIIAVRALKELASYKGIELPIELESHEYPWAK